MDNQKLWVYLSGSENTELVVAGLIFIAIGTIISLGMKVVKGIEVSTDSPNKFDIAYFFEKNWIKSIIGVLVACVCLRFASLLEFVNQSEVTLLALATAFGILGYELTNSIIKRLIKLQQKLDE